MVIRKIFYFFICLSLVYTLVQCNTKKVTNKTQDKKVEVQKTKLNIKESFKLLDFKAPLNLKVDSMPAFELEDINGNKITNAQFKNKMILLIFWATWCPYCTKEMPTVEKLYQKVKNDPNFVIVSVCLNQDKESIPLYAEMNGYNFTILLDPNNILYKKFVDKLKTPTTYLIAKDNTILGKIVSKAHDWSTDTALNFFRTISTIEKPKLF